MYGGRDGRVWEMGAEKCGKGVGKCVGGMGRVEKCGVGVEKCVGVWVRGDVEKCVGVWGRCRELLGEVCWGVGGDVRKCWGRCGGVGKRVGVWGKVWKSVGEGVGKI